MVVNEPTNAAPPTGAGRRYASTAVKLGFGLAVLAFGAVFVASRWDQLRSALKSARPGWIVAAVAFAIVGEWAAVLGFRAVLAATARWLPLLAVARVYFVSQLGKYIPGSLWPIVALTEMCRRHSIPRSAGAAAGIIGLGFTVVIAGLVGIPLVIIGAAGHAPLLLLLLLIIPLGVAVLHPAVLRPLVNMAMRITRQPPIELDLGRAVFGRAVSWNVVSWLLLGAHAWALVVALGGDPLRSLAPAIGGFAVAYAAGTLFIPAPAGAGVREAVLAIALTGVIHDSSGFNHDSVIVVVLLSRVLLALVDFGQAAAVLALTHKRARR